MGVMDKLLRRSETPKPLFGGEKQPVGYNHASDKPAYLRANTSGQQEKR